MPGAKSYLKNDALSLREKGYSYELIRQKTGVSKSTLSDWLKRLPYKPNAEVLERMKRGQIKSSGTLRRLRLERIKEARRIAKQELGQVSKRDLMLLGIGLYIGEGSKDDRGSVSFANSDPKVVKLMVNWFTKVVGVEIRNFYIRVHTYPDNDIKETLEFWSKATSIPINQFGKTYIDRRKDKLIKNKNKLPYGTAHIRIRAFGKKEFGTNLLQKIVGWIELTEDQIQAGIV